MIYANMTADEAYERDQVDERQRQQASFHLYNEAFDPGDQVATEPASTWTRDSELG